MMNIASKTGFKDWLELYSTYDAEGENTLAKTDTQSDIVLKGFKSSEANQVIDHHTLFPDTAFFVGYKDTETGKIRLMVFHHLFKNTAAGFQFDKDVHEVFALNGFKRGDRVVKIDTSLFDETKNRWFTPTLADFVAASENRENFISLESVDEVLPEDKKNNKMPNGDPLPYLENPRKAISVLPFLVSTVLGMEEEEPILILRNVLIKIKDHIEEFLNKEAGEDLWKDCFLMIKQIWFMSQNFEEKINPMLPEDGKIAKRTKIDSTMERQGRAIELMYLGTQVNPTPIPVVANSTPAIIGVQAPVPATTTAVQTAVVANVTSEALMQQMVEAMKTSNVIMGEFNRNKNSTNSEGKWEKRFSVDIKTFILYASATSKTSHPEAPNESYRQLLDDTKVQALSNASQAIINIGGGSQLVDLAKAQMLYNCQQINDTFGAHPKGLSIFFAVPAPVMGSKIMTGEEYQVRVDTHNLSDAQLMKALSQKVQVPNNVYSFFTTYRNFLIELEYQFGELSLIFQKNQRFHDELSINERVVAIMAASHPNFIASVMAKIDIRNQKFLRSCAKASSLRQVDFEALNFYDDINKISLQENLTVTLPVTVHQIVQSASKSPNQQKGVGAQGKRDAIDSEDEDDQGMGGNGGDRKAKAAAAKKAKKLIAGVAKKHVTGRRFLDQERRNVQ